MRSPFAGPGKKSTQGKWWKTNTEESNISGDSPQKIPSKTWWIYIDVSDAVLSILCLFRSSKLEVDQLHSQKSQNSMTAPTKIHHNLGQNLYKWHIHNRPQLVKDFRYQHSGFTEIQAYLTTYSTISGDQKNQELQPRITTSYKKMVPVETVHCYMSELFLSGCLGIRHRFPQPNPMGSTYS